MNSTRCPYPACASPFDCGHLGVCLGQPQTPHDSTRCAATCAQCGASPDNVVRKRCICATPAEGEAVAYLNVRVDGAKILDYEPWKEPWTATPLYTTPPRSPATVTEGEVEHAIRSAMDFCHNSQDWEQEGGAWATYIAPMLAKIRTGGRDAE